ncbi:HNH endonuclease [Streptomyces phage Galactica]|nr:HNH endonuclease [Streptomyces phage Galactica]
MDELKTCTKCKTAKPRTEFHKHKSCKDGLNSQCKECVRAKVRDWYHENQGANRDRLRTRRLNRKQEAVDHYGGKCACCGETELVFLTFDHIDGGGRKHREEGGLKGHLLMWLRRNGYPAGFQVLCWNCNSAKHILGTCPHQLG